MPVGHLKQKLNLLIGESIEYRPALHFSHTCFAAWFPSVSTLFVVLVPAGHRCSVQVAVPQLWHVSGVTLQVAQSAEHVGAAGHVAHSFLQPVLSELLVHSASHWLHEVLPVLLWKYPCAQVTQLRPAGVVPNLPSEQSTQMDVSAACSRMC